MGANQSGRSGERNGTLDEEVNFDHFQILRAIGKGSFGKVCIVQKKDCKTLYAMKYMNKAQCEQRDALRNVCREVEILTALDHPFLVNLWFSFQDEEDLFMVSDLLLGGDLRYHIQQEVPFNEECVTLYVAELALALDYLQAKHIVHRDIKPDNILLDEEGHAHLTDFNIAAVLEEGQLATSMSGTKPYMAPEIFACAMDECVGYSYPVDWWSLGVVAYEMLSGTRPYDIHSATSISDVRGLFLERLHYRAAWSAGLVELVGKLLSVRPGARLSSLVELRKMPCFQNMNFDKITAKKSKPPFCPPKDHLNCDPTFELEEMIIETRPLHKKKKRLAKQRSLRETQGYSVDLDCDTPPEHSLQHLSEYYIYNRERELAKRERESKESAWEEELLEAMRASEANPTSPQSCPRSQHDNTDSKPLDESTSTATDGISRSQLHIAGQIRILEQKISEFCSQDPSRSFEHSQDDISNVTNTRVALNVGDANFSTCVVNPVIMTKCRPMQPVQTPCPDWPERQGQNLNFRQETAMGSNLEFIDRTPSPDERAASISVTQSCSKYQ